MVNKPWPFRTILFPDLFTEKAVLYRIGVKRREFVEFATNKALFYKIDKELKKNGGFRDIYKPSWKFKSLLRKINSRILSRFNFPGFVHCGPTRRSIVTASRGHNNFKFHLSLDVKAFFDNVSEAVVRDTLRKVGITKEVTATILSVAIEHNRLPQGFPTSPLLAALVISHTLQNFYVVFNKKEILLSVYADDILISSNEENLIWEAKKFIQERLAAVNLELNSKENFAKNGEHLTWLSLQIYPWVTVPRARLLSLEKQIYIYKMTGIVPSDFKPKKLPKKPYDLRELWEGSLTGKVVFVKSVSSTRLATKLLEKLQ